MILGAFSLAACQDVGNASSPVPGMSISLTGDLCPSIEISAGDQVTWTNQAQEPHQITGLTEEAEPLFDSGVLNQGDSFSFTFPEAGSYAYTCSTDQDFPATLTVLP